MPRPFPSLTLSLALLACAGSAAAQTAAQTAAQAPAQAQNQPPVTEPIEAGSDEPATRIEPRRGPRITEKRHDGQVTEIEVQSGKSRYIMRPNRIPGNPQAGPAQSSSFGSPQWQVKDFDMNAKRKAVSDADAAAVDAAAAGATPARAAAAVKPATGSPAGSVPPATVPMLDPADVPPPPPMPTKR